ncbi:energy-coupling factor ABC transporter permease [Guggenheimella bovis]
MTKKEKSLLVLALVVAFGFGIVPTASGMHIMEGYLSLPFCIAWGAVCLPFLIHSYFSMKRIVSERRETVSLLAMMGAFIFVLSALKIPSVTGSSSHPTGTGLGAVLFGASPIALLGLIVLLFQAVLLAHGGLTTLGANTFSMAIVGPIVSAVIYKMMNKMKAPKHFSIFLAVALGNLTTYVVTSVQLALMHQGAGVGFMTSLTKFLMVFAVTQIPLAIIEGLVSVILVMALEKYAAPELKRLGYER